MTYKTLVRKSDGQYVDYYEGIDITSETPVLYTDNDVSEFKNKLDWSLYNLIKVVVIPMDKLPQQNIIMRKIHSILQENNSEIVSMKKLAEWVKYKIIKP